MLQTADISTTITPARQGAPASARSARTGRRPAVPVPDTEIPEAWSGAWDGFHFHLLSLDRSACTIRNRRSPAPAVPGHAELNAVLAACAGRDRMSTRNRAIVLLLLGSGLRREEVCRLGLDDVDIRARTVAVRRGKGGKARISIFGDAAAEALHRYVRTRKAKGIRHGDELFTSLRHSRMSVGGMSEMLSALGRKAGVPGLRARLFRHARAHLSLSKGMQEHNLVELAGWSTSKQIGRYGAALAQQRAIAAGRELQAGDIIKGK
jgi:integrase